MNLFGGLMLWIMWLDNIIIFHKSWKSLLHSTVQLGLCGRTWHVNRKIGGKLCPLPDLIFNSVLLFVYFQWFFLDGSEHLHLFELFYLVMGSLNIILFVLRPKLSNIQDVIVNRKTMYFNVALTLNFWW